MKTIPGGVTACLLLLAAAAPAPAAEPAPPAKTARAAAAEIDALLAAHWKANGVARNEPLSDEGFVRRIYLDLAGRIPTGDEAAAFLRSTAPDKRAALIDDLLARDSYAARFFHLWADALRYKSRAVNRANVVEAAYGKYIRDSLRANKPYDRFVRDLLAAKGHAWDNGAVGYYHRDPDMPLDNMAITSRIFLGTRIECAQCHDHPFDKWKQTEFYHLAAYTYGVRSVFEPYAAVRAAVRSREQAIQADFLKEKAAAADGGRAAAEKKKARLDAIETRGIAGVIKGCVGQLFSPVGLDRDLNRVLKLPHDFKEKDGKPFEAMAPATPMGPAAPVAPGRDPAEAFADWVASPKNPRFTRVVVNRLWRELFGVPLTEAFDDLRDDTVAMVPEVEAYLERLMVASGYDMKFFLAAVANTQAYQSAAGRDEFARGGTYHFTGPVLRRMSAEQVWDSAVALASHEPDARDRDREAREERRVNVSKMAFEAYLEFDGEKLLDMAAARLVGERELAKRELAIREEMVVAKRNGETGRLRDLAHKEGDIARERGEALAREFILPLLDNLARKKVGPNAAAVPDPTYQVHPNARIFASETWRRMYVPGYGPAPKTQAEKDADARAERQRLIDLAAKLGFTGADRDGFVAYCERGRGEWVRASELESPAPRGHFLRTMGQSDRDFVDNADRTPTIPQALLLLNGELVTERGVLSPYSPLMAYVSRGATADARVENLFLAVLSRTPTPSEQEAVRAETAHGLTLADVAHALLNTKQFVFVR
ncbi:Uncharacterized protein OS=Lentisphaera araneosa HTCC2155 GN=LNTAR_10901 PE=4 SV=1: PSCyt2: PSD1: PSD1 [Gemmataceae bacterium]|nr:Uncharacterized protein OS=Lentisphaera araneosa HTCC2155 GN=LNTAR_10901 PE=4 SV=1: PSCyt2: PSD1: PSD1 [Gemmataceae bacterium]VTT96479.1 Uncharacterized protein OS=Lentisphaera araneosa HTCC2155 GN=LNTAR_10901 PE=4 SV=1: PSCyt2: PSD1: PSD1 [Gemmataceae bacterium]